MLSPSLLRRDDPAECEATHRPHSSVRYLVEPVDGCDRGSRRHHDHPIRARTRPARSGPERDHERAASADQSRLPAPRLAGRGRGRRPGDLRPLVRHVPTAAGRHRVPRRLADDGRQPHLPRPARLGPGPAGALRGRMDPRAAARACGVDQRAVRRRHRRPGRPGHPRRVGQHGLPRRARIDDPGRARRVHPPRRLPLPLRRSRRDRRPYAGGMPPAGLVGPPPHPRVAGARGPGGRPGRHRQGLQAGMGGQGHRRPHRPARPRRHRDRRRRRPRQRRAPPDRRRRADRALVRRRRRPDARRDDPGAHRQRSARSGRLSRTASP